MRDLRLNQLVYGFTAQFTEYIDEYDQATRRYKRVPRVWGGRLVDNSIFRFPIGALPGFIQFMKAHGVYENEIDYYSEPTYTPAPANFKLISSIVPYDYQVEAIEYTDSARLRGAPSVLITKPPGSGKTVTFCKYLEMLKVRASMVIAPTYIEKWKADAEEYLELDVATQVYALQGAKSIRKAAEMASANVYDYDLTLISLRTFVEFMKAYEESPHAALDEYGTTPIDIWRLLQIGILGGDEAHEQFYSVYWMHTFIHGPFHLALSATMMDRDSKVEARQEIIYPAIRRFDKIKMRKYIGFINVDYSFANVMRDKIRFSNPRSSDYSQQALEKSIMKNMTVRTHFLEMIEWCIRTFWLHNTHRPGDKLALFFYRLDLIEVVHKFVAKTFPGKDVRIFQGGSDYKDLMEPDVRVTNVGSAGTGKDIKGLTTVINFHSLDSNKANIQLLGRIREIIGRDDLYFVQLNCMNSPKQMKYKHRRNELLKERTRFISSRQYGKALGKQAW